MADDFPRCRKCAAVVDNFRFPVRFDDLGPVCQHCDHIERVSLDVTINPLPDHMQPWVEAYIRFREDRAVAKFVLEQQERVSAGKQSTT